MIKKAFCIVEDHGRLKTPPHLIEFATMPFFLESTAFSELQERVKTLGNRSVSCLVQLKLSKEQKKLFGRVKPDKEAVSTAKKNMHINARYELAKHVNRLNCTFLYVEVFSNKFANKLMFSCDVA